MGVKITGTVLNSKNYNPIVHAKIRLKVQDKEIGIPFTDEKGFYEFKTDNEYIGQTLTYTIEKDGFEEKTYHSDICKPDIQKKFLLREHGKIPDTKTSLMFTILGIGIIAVAVLLFLLLQPNMDVEKEDEALVFNNLYLNDSESKTFKIMKKEPKLMKGFEFNIWKYKIVEDLTWTVISDEAWIELDPEQGNKTEDVKVNVYAPDTEVSPVTKVSTNLTIRRKGGWFNGKLADTEVTKKLIISVYDTSEKSYKPVLNVTKPKDESWDPSQNLKKSFNISIKNTGDGGLFWTVRNDVEWIHLVKVDNKDVSVDKFRLVGFDEGNVTFDINASGLREGDTKTGNIFIESNNDGKFKITYKINRSEERIFVHPILHRYEWTFSK
jgi:hypothetical protein